MRDRTADKFDQELIAKRGQIVEIPGPAGDVAAGRLVWSRPDYRRTGRRDTGRRRRGPGLAVGKRARFGRLTIELEQDGLREPQAVRTRPADVGNRLDLGACPDSRLAKCRLRERPPDETRLRRGQPEDGRANTAIGDRRSFDQRAAPADPNPARKVETSISFRLEILYSLTISSGPVSGIVTVVMISSGARTVCLGPV